MQEATVVDGTSNCCYNLPESGKTAGALLIMCEIICLVPG